MGKPSFYLKKAEPISGKSLIFLRYLYNGYTLTWTFGQSIDPKQWHKKYKRVKDNKITTEDGTHSLNDMLDTIEEIAKKAYYTELKNGIPTPDVIKQYLNKWLSREKGEDDSKKYSLYKLIERFIANEIHYNGKDKAEATIKKYRTIYNHLKDFEKTTKYKVDYDTINLQFFYKYVTYLKSIPFKDKEGNILKVGLSQNSIAKDITTLKVFMNEAVDLGETKNTEFRNKKFSVKQEETDAIYLTESELMNLFNHDLSSNKRLEQVKDLFVFGAFTGLRFSDYTSVKPNNIIDRNGELFINMKTTKTGETVIIPCHPIILQIFDKYKDSPNKLPKAISNQKFNEYIKEACKEVGLTEKGRLVSEPDSELWELVSSHTARRSFATNLYLDNFPTQDIMKITGHRTEKSFQKYIRTTKLDAANRLSAHTKKSWAAKSNGLRVVA